MRMRAGAMVDGGRVADVAAALAAAEMKVPARHMVAKCRVVIHAGAPRIRLPTTVMGAPRAIHLIASIGVKMDERIVPMDRRATALRLHIARSNYPN
jgi:hypothetical protein